MDMVLRLARAEARANAAADRAEKLCRLLELKLADEQEGTPDTLERLDVQESAIMELAEIISEQGE